MLTQVLGQVGKLHRAKQCAVQAHQKNATQKRRHMMLHEAPTGEQHDGNFQALDEADQHRLVVLVGELPAGGRKEQKRQDEKRTNHQARRAGGQPAHLDLVGDEHGKSELEQVVVARAQKLHPEEGRKAALAQQRKLVGVRGVHVGR